MPADAVVGFGRLGDDQPEHGRVFAVGLVALAEQAGAQPIDVPTT